MRRIIIGLTLILAMLAGANAEPRLAGVGVVLLHGKRVAPPDNLTPVRSALEAAGARVVVPEMSWSRARAYDGTFEQAMEDIDRHVGALRGAGATRIVVAGHGMGRTRRSATPRAAATCSRSPCSAPAIRRSAGSSAGSRPTTSSGRAG